MGHLKIFEGGSSVGRVHLYSALRPISCKSFDSFFNTSDWTRHDCTACASMSISKWRKAAGKPGIPTIGDIDSVRMVKPTVNSLMFVGINLCIFETKQCLRGLIFAVSSGLVNR